MLKLSSVRAERPQPASDGDQGEEDSREKWLPMRLWTTTLKAGSELLMMWVKDTATLDMLTVAATWPMVCATATCNPDRTGARWGDENATPDSCSS